MESVMELVAGILLPVLAFENSNALRLPLLVTYKKINLKFNDL